MKEKNKNISRRDFIKTTGAGLAGAALVSGSLFPFKSKALAAVAPPDLAIEKNAVLRVLRWSPFVKSDGEYWEKNSRKWEQVTGGKVITEYLSWEDVRPKAAMEAAVGAGHDLISGWHDDPHIYPEKLIDVSDVCEYLGKKYGGWEPVCFKYAMKDGRWIAVPMGGPGQEIVYRKSWVNEAGYDTFPTKIEDFIKICKKLKSMGHPVGFAMGHAVGDGNNWVHTWLWAFGAKTVNKDGSVAINSPETRNALEGMKELYDDAMTAGQRDQHLLRGQGKAGMGRYCEGYLPCYPTCRARGQADRATPVQPSLHLQAHALPQRRQALHNVHARGRAVRPMDQRHAGVRDPGSQSLSRSPRLDRRSQAYPVP
jgi:multiple sugar transport system substrate-binding protein